MEEQLEFPESAGFPKRRIPRFRLSQRPTSLAGFQLVCTGVVMTGDLLVPCTTLSPADWEWADGAVGSPVTKGGTTMHGTWRVYRESETPRHLDK